MRIYDDSEEDFDDDDEMSPLLRSMLFSSSRSNANSQPTIFLRKRTPLWLLVSFGMVCAIIGILALPVASSGIVDRIRNSVPIPGVGAFAPTSNRAPCVDIVDSVNKGGIDIAKDPRYTLHGKNIIVLGNFQSSDSKYWEGQPNGWHRAWDIVGNQGTPAYTPTKLIFRKHSVNTYDCCFGDVMVFEWPGGVAAYGKPVYFYFGHLQNIPPLKEGDEYPAGTLMGETNAAAHTHWHISFDPSGGPWGDIDNNEWWAANCGTSSSAVVGPDFATNLIGPPTISAEGIDTVLRLYNSPAAGMGKVIYDEGVARGINPAFMLAFFIHESTAGTNPGWAGLISGGGTTYNIGNIICAGYATCFNRFRQYNNWQEGIADWYDLLNTEYINGRSAKTLEDIIPVYAPSFENDVPGYINTVRNMVSCWHDNPQDLGKCQ